jgi:hypothetical protein
MQMLERTRDRRDQDGRERDRHIRDEDRERRLPPTQQERGAVRERQREEFGGINWGSAFFGWLVAIGVGVILTALLSAAGAAVGLTEVSEGAARSNAETIGIVGGALLILVAVIAYYAGGYVAGRMSRFDGARQGLGVWGWSVIATLVLAVVGAIAGSEYNVFGQLDLPRIPIDEGSLTAGGAIALAAIVIGSLLASMAGGKAGERYHRKVDRVGDEHAARDRDREREDPAPERDDWPVRSRDREAAR